MEQNNSIDNNQQSEKEIKECCKNCKSFKPSIESGTGECWEDGREKDELDVCSLFNKKIKVV